MRWTQDEFEAYIARTKKWDGDLDPTPDSGKESRLQSKCEKWLKQRGYVYFHDRSRRKNKAGIPDLIIFAPEGRTVIVELKAKDGRKTPEQIDTIRMLKYNKHEVYEIRSFKRFVQVMDGKRREH